MGVSIKHPTGQANFSCVSINGLTLWFSYETVIAFQTTGNRVVSENVWSQTTGKHLNHLCDKRDRVPRAEFNQRLAEALTEKGL